MKLAVIGSRGITTLKLEAYLPEGVTHLVTGGAKGVDTLAEQYARIHGIPVTVIPPDYARYGKGAPLVRDRQIVSFCDELYAFWDGVSTGTAYTVRYARGLKKPVRLFRLKTL